MTPTWIDEALARVGCVLFGLAWLVGTVALLGTCGCGGSALRTQAQAAYATGAVIREAGATVEARLEADLAECVQMLRPSDGLACVERAEATYQPIVHAHAAALSAHQAWALALLAALDEGVELGVAEVVEFVAAVLRAYSSAREAASDIGLQLPALPEVPQ